MLQTKDAQGDFYLKIVGKVGFTKVNLAIHKIIPTVPNRSHRRNAHYPCFVYSFILVSWRIIWYDLSLENILSLHFARARTHTHTHTHTHTKSCIFLRGPWPVRTNSSLLMSPSFALINQRFGKHSLKLSWAAKATKTGTTLLAATLRWEASDITCPHPHPCP